MRILDEHFRVLSLEPSFTLDKIRRSHYLVSFPRFLTEISTRYLTRLGINIRNISETPLSRLSAALRQDEKRSRKIGASLCEREGGKGSKGKKERDGKICI